MNCSEARHAILDGLEIRSLQDHLAACKECQSFAAEQMHLDSVLRGAFRGPVLSPGFRRNLSLQVRKERLRARWRWVAVAVAPCSAAVTSTACALLIPTHSRLFLILGLSLTVLSYASSIAFEWLTEELEES